MQKIGIIFTSYSEVVVDETREDLCRVILYRKLVFV
jgi:hypothetical protein